MKIREADESPHDGEEMPKRSAFKIVFTLVMLAGSLGALGALASGTSLAATQEQAHVVAGTAAVSPEYTCYFPITGFYCYAQTQNGNAPLLNPSGSLHTRLPLNDKVKITCWYPGNPPSPWLSDGYMDHVTWENISDPITGHIPDSYVNLGGQDPWQAGIPQC
jgi:hypothetical protein